jgi:hypothetical protein
MKLIFDNEILTTAIQKYPNGRTRIQLFDQDGFPYMTATINVPTIVLENDEVIIKDYFENKGIYKALVDAGIISTAISKIDVGYGTSPICKLLI